MLKGAGFSRLLTVVAVVCSVGATSLRASPFDSGLRFERFSLEQGLSQSSVNAIHQDRRGFLWVATADGLNRYDGYRFQVMHHEREDPNSLPNNAIWCIHEDSRGNLWIGTDGGGLSRYDLATESFTNYAPDPSQRGSLRNGVVQAMTEAPLGILWIGTDEGLWSLDLEAPEARFEAFAGRPEDAISLGEAAITALVSDENGHLWVGTYSSGVFRVDVGEMSVAPIALRTGELRHRDDDYVRALTTDRFGDLWVGTNRGGLVRVDTVTGRFQDFRHRPGDPHSLSNDRIRALFEDRHGELWIGTDGGGLNRFDRETESFVAHSFDPGDPRSLSFDTVRSLTEDASGLLWVGTDGGGLCMNARHQEVFALFRHDPKDGNTAARDMVMALLEDRNGTVWVGSYGGGLTRIDRARKTYELLEHQPGDPSSLASNIVLSILEDREGNIWVATADEGLDRYDPDSGGFEHFRSEPSNPATLSDDQVWDLVEGLDGSIWVGTAFGGLNRLDPSSGRVTRHGHDPARPGSLGSNFVVSLFVDSRGSVWVGTEHGLNRLDDPSTGEFTSFRDEHDMGLADEWILCITEALGAIWVGTYSSGLYRIDQQDDAVVRFGLEDGLPSEAVYGIVEDDEGRLWLSTNSGISRVTAGQSSRAVEFRNFDASYGLQSDEFNQGAYARSERTGEIFFGGISGFNSFFPRQVETSLFVPQIVITGFSVFNRPVHVGDLNAGDEVMLSRHISEVDNVVLTHHENSFSFEFAALDFAAPGRNLYAYRMLGFHDEWVEADASSRVATYTNLDPGQYTFQVRGTNKDHVWNEQGASILVTISPPFWATWWFRILAVMAVVGSAFGLHHRRMAKIAERSRELEEMNARLNREIDERLRAEADVRKLNVELEERVRQRTADLESSNQELEAFAYSVSHDLRAPLRVIDGFSQAVLEDWGDCLDATGRNYLERVRAGSQKMDRLIDELLTLSRITRMEMQRAEVDVSAVARDVLHELREANPEREMTAVVQPGITTVGDPALLRVVIQNLIDNAWKFTSHRSNPRIEVCTELHGEEEAFVVRDNGAGFDMAYVDKLFGTFQRLHSEVEFEGTGIGLATVMRAVTRHGGRVWAEGEVDKGAAFFVAIGG